MICIDIFDKDKKLIKTLVLFDEDYICSDCQGRGYINIIPPSKSYYSKETKECKNCGGAGKRSYYTGCDFNNAWE